MQRDRLFNLLSLVMLGLTVLTIGCYILIVLNPYIPLNPFPPARPALTVVATLTPTPLVRKGAPTWTPTPTPTITPTPPPSFTPTATPIPPTRTPVPPTRTLTPTPSPTPRVTRSPYPFTYVLNYETPYYGCTWMGVGGTVQDLDGNPLKDYRIHVWGGGIDVVILSGSKQIYGDSGWEQFFLNQPVEMNGIFHVQLHSPYAPHTPVSEEITLNYPGLCSKSLALITFTKNH